MHTILQRILASLSSLRGDRQTPNDPVLIAEGSSPEPAKPQLVKRLKSPTSAGTRKPPSLHDIASNM